jgi:hypothetical protein
MLNGLPVLIITRLAKLLAKHGELLSTDYTFSSRGEAQTPLGRQFVQGRAFLVSD